MEDDNNLETKIIKSIDKNKLNRFTLLVNSTIIDTPTFIKICDYLYIKQLTGDYTYFFLTLFKSPNKRTKSSIDVNEWIKICNENIHHAIHKETLNRHNIKNNKLQQMILLYNKYNPNNNIINDIIVNLVSNVRCISLDEFINNFRACIDGFISSGMLTRKEHVYIYLKQNITIETNRSNFWCSLLATYFLTFIYGIKIAGIITSPLHYLSIISDEHNKIPIIYADDCIYSGEQFRRYSFYEYFIGRPQKYNTKILVCIPYISTTHLKYIQINKFMENNVFYSPNTTIIRSTYDLTNEVLARYNKKNPPVVDDHPLLNTRLLTYFEHKYADLLSLNEEILKFGDIYSFDNNFNPAHIESIGSLVECDANKNNIECYDSFYSGIKYTLDDKPLRKIYNYI